MEKTVEFIVDNFQSVGQICIIGKNRLCSQIIVSYSSLSLQIEEFNGKQVELVNQAVESPMKALTDQLH